MIGRIRHSFEGDPGGVSVPPVGLCAPLSRHLGHVAGGGMITWIQSRSRPQSERAFSSGTRST